MAKLLEPPLTWSEEDRKHGRFCRPSEMAHLGNGLAAGTGERMEVDDQPEADATRKTMVEEGAPLWMLTMQASLSANQAKTDERLHAPSTDMKRVRTDLDDLKVQQKAQGLSHQVLVDKVEVSSLVESRRVVAVAMAEVRGGALHQ